MTLNSGSLPGSLGAAFPKRFYKAAAVAPETDGFALTLDGKPARTPSRQAIVLPTRELAQAIADEWAAVETLIDPRDMPFTRLANSVIDGVSKNMTAVRDEIVRYGKSDLLVYRAAEPVELVAIQSSTWDPVLAWARASFGARFASGEGVMYVEQPGDLEERIGEALDAACGSDAGTPFRLGALHVATTLTGSTLLALAVAHGRLRPDEAWTAAHVDEDFQIARWGADAEAEQRRSNRWKDMQVAGRVFGLLHQ